MVLQVANPSLQSKLMEEEIFGPILVVQAVDSIDAAVAHINSKEHPLALYVNIPHQRNFVVEN